VKGRRDDQQSRDGNDPRSCLLLSSWQPAEQVTIVKRNRQATTF
jgi:hypothetical protein